MRERFRAFRTALERSLREFPVTTVIGLRQVGKTTLVRQAPGSRPFVTLDDLGALDAARKDPEGFLRGLPRPVTIDEVQRAPELLLPIKREVDRRRAPGRFLLTGSARIDLRRGVRETLAGRSSILRLRPMTWAEADRRPDWNPLDRLLACRSAAEAASAFRGARAFDATRVLAGGLPIPLLGRPGAVRARWLEEYRKAYVERDLPPLLQLDELPPFLRYLGLAASRTAQTTNYAALAHDAGVSTDTSLRWSGVLEATFLVDLLPPWWRNIGKRLVKAPKLHFGDAGLAASLLGLRTWAEAVRLNAAGALLETLVAQHLLAFAESSRTPASLFHYRTHAGAEADFVVSRGRRLLPIEVKLSATPSPSQARGLESFLGDFGGDAPFGVVLHAAEEPVSLGRNVVALPLGGFLAGL